MNRLRAIPSFLATLAAWWFRLWLAVTGGAKRAKTAFERALERGMR